MTTHRPFLALVPLLLLVPALAPAMCIPFFCEDCDLQARGQLNFVVMDREAGRIHLIPNVRIAGNANDFALLVPTPTVPDFMPVAREIWDEAFALTAPVRVQNRNSGCNSSSVVASPGVEATRDDDVVVVAEQTVGDFIATTVSASTSAALVAWLNDHNFTFAPEDIEAFDPYVAEGWVFTAMLLDPSVTAPPAWDTSVDPVILSFAAENLEVPLPLLRIHRADDYPVVFFVVDDHRATLPGFDTAYAERLSDREVLSIRYQYPTVGAFLETGRVLTRLDRRFDASAPMDASIFLGRSLTDREVRRTTGGATPFGASVPWLLVTGVFLGREVRRRRREDR